ncbi:MAG TPA: GtrA family protein [Acidimicrobiales bacterium]|nr:GtrA family protein [Acidimicrobiales bacterium]
MSVIAILIGQVALVAYYYFAHWSARPATFAATITAGVPGYYLNRQWVWGRSGRSHLLREVVPFWVLTLVGLLLSTLLAGYAESFAEARSDSRALHTVLVDVASLVAFGALWVLKFVAFNRFMFGFDETPR